MEKGKVLFLIKFGEKDYMNNLFEKGSIFMQRLSNFRGIEHNEIGDVNEGLNYSLQPDRTKVEINEKQINGICSPIKTINNTANDPLIYCMYAYTSDHSKEGKEYYLDEQLQGLGDTAVLIKDIDKFLSMISKKLPAIISPINFRPVEYVDPDKFNGEMNAFNKYSKYKHQNECRFVFEGDFNGSACSFEIGSLREIAEIYSSKNLIKTLKVTY